MKNLITILLTLIICHAVAFTQERTHLPYSVYGIGELTPKGFARNMAMGKTGIALSSSKYLNNVNPASYHSIDSISFFFNLGLSGDMVNYRTSSHTSQNGTDVNLRNMAIGFRITPKWSSSIGIAPYSSVGYKIETQEEIEGTHNQKFDATMTGSGGLNQFYWNNSYLLFKNLSLGVSFNYLLGSIESNETSSFDEYPYEIVIDQTSYLNKVYADFGLQYMLRINENIGLTLGGIYGNSHKLNFKDRFTVYESSGDVTEDEITERGTFDFPWHAGGGITFQYKDKLTVSADYLYHNWSNTDDSNTDSDNPDYYYNDNDIIRFGVEYVPGNYTKLGYFGGIAYRAGCYYEESYLKIKKTAMSDKGITLGLGLPFLQNKTSINIAYNFGIYGTIENGLIRETYNSIMFSLTLHDWWFLKRKID